LSIKVLEESVPEKAGCFDDKADEHSGHKRAAPAYRTGRQQLLMLNIAARSKKLVFTSKKDKKFFAR
jgi:hypothetical protein